jgi:protein gp37
MGQTSEIAWLRGDDGSPGKVWNPVRGCSKVSPGCEHCYAEVMAARFPWGKPVTANGRWSGKIQLLPEKLAEPLGWKKPCRVFVNSVSDLFHDGVPEEFIRAVFTTMARARAHTFLVLTKRPRRMLDVMSAWERDGLTLREGCGVVLPNVWLGVTAEDQARADERIPVLLQTPAAVRFVSVEPMLGAVDLSRFMWPTHWHWDAKFKTPEAALAAGAFAERQRQSLVHADCRFIDWAIVGGESGTKARPLDLAWARSIQGQCRAAGVPYFFKQMGRRAFVDRDEPECRFRLADPAGADPSEFPEDLRVRESPAQEARR